MRIGALIDKISIVKKWPSLRRPDVKKTATEVVPETLPLRAPVEPVTPDAEPKVVPVSLANVVKERPSGTPAENSLSPAEPIDLVTLAEASLSPAEPIDLVTLAEASDTSAQASVPVLPSDKTGAASVSQSAPIGMAQAIPAHPEMANGSTALSDGVSSGIKQGAAEEPGKGNEEDLFKQLFNKQEEKEETPLDRLVAALPEVSMLELFDQAETVRALMREWPQS